MNSLIILSVVLSILASNGVHGKDFRNYRMLAFNKPQDFGFMPLFNAEQRMAPQQPMVNSEQRMVPQQPMFNSEQRMAPQQPMFNSEQRMAPQQPMFNSEQRMAPQQSIVMSEQRIVQQQPMSMPEQRMVQQQPMVMPEQRIVQQQPMMLPEQRMINNPSLNVPQQRVEQQQLLQQQMQQQQMLQRQQQAQQQQMQMQRQQLAQLNKPAMSGQLARPIGRQMNSQESFCQGRTPDSVIAHPTDPSKFIACHSGNDFDIMNCPSGLIFNTGLLRCDNSRTVRGCATNPCRNGGVCSDTASGMYQCSCPAGFMGINCERDDHCSPNSCGPEGVCVPLGPGSPIGHYCICSSGKTFGMTCDLSNVEDNPCDEHSTESLHFPTKANQAIFVHCDGVLPNLKFCPWPLTFNVNKQECDWRS